MNKFILIKVTNNIKRFIDKCKKYEIDLHNVTYIDENKIIVKINKKDLEFIKKYNYYSEIETYSKLGIDSIKEKIFNQKYFILLFIFCLIGMYFISNFILKINVIHSNKKIRELVREELNEYGISKYSYKKDFKELNKIKNKILEDKKDKLEWISITNIGMTYVVRIEERIIDEIKTKNEYCNVYANKEALITNIYSTAGEIIVSVNDIIKPNDLLISGTILLNEETKGYTCANGKIMGKVWYTTNISLEREYYKKEYTGKSRLNFSINKKVLRNNKYTKFDKKYFIKTKFFTLYKELEYKNKKYKYNNKESLEQALLEVDNKFKIKLGDNGKVLSKKILNKEITDKSINLSVFVTTEENIAKQEVLSIPNLDKIKKE